MRLALSTALIVMGEEGAAETRLSAGFRAVGLPVIHAAGPNSAFAQAGLEAGLEEQGILTLVLCGGPPAAIEATARDAGKRGFRVFVAGDGAAVSTEEVVAALEILRARRAP